MKYDKTRITFKDSALGKEFHELQLVYQNLLSRYDLFIVTKLQKVDPGRELRYIDV
jgi:hypothetical protein